MAREIPVPDELKVLLPETDKAVIVVGSKGYELLPLYEGQLESVTADIAKVYDAMFSPDRKCPKCGKVVRYAIPKKIFDCPDDNEPLEDVAKSPMEAILSSGKVPKWIEMITGVPETEVKASITLKQIKHFAGLFWKQNFSDDEMPEESKANFQKLLKMIGMAPEKKEESPAAKPTEPSPPA